MTNPEGDLLGLRRKTVDHLKGDNPYMSDYYKSFLMGLAFGPVYSLPAFGKETISLTTTGTGSSPKAKSGTATGMAFAFAHDVYAKARGLGTLAEGRLLLTSYVKSVPLLPAAYVAAGVLAVKGGIRAHDDWHGHFKHQKLVGSSVGTSYSPKPFWLPLPLWGLFQ